MRWFFHRISTEKLPSLSSLEVLRILKKYGFKEVRTHGSHSHLERTSESGPVVRVSVPLGKRDIPTGTLHSIIKKSQLSREVFFKKTKRGNKK